LCLMILLDCGSKLNAGRWTACGEKLLISRGDQVTQRAMDSLYSRPPTIRKEDPEVPKPYPHHAISGNRSTPSSDYCIILDSLIPHEVAWIFTIEAASLVVRELIAQALALPGPKMLNGNGKKGLGRHAGNGAK
jgi:hypothetical protein